ncbi:MAG: chemotaxis protein CheW [Methanomicrobiales archaeon]|nr:chemotaxis protein CheW [Methanomicrobiales archaeon]
MVDQDAAHLPLFVFSVGHVTCALPLGEVEQAVHMVAVTPLPRLPPLVRGVINLHGRIVPVISVRTALGMPEREVQSSDVLVIARTARRIFALHADAAFGVVEQESPTVAPNEFSGERTAIRGAITLPDGVLLILDLDAFLSSKEDEALSAELASAGGAGPGS